MRKQRDLEPDHIGTSPCGPGSSSGSPPRPRSSSFLNGTDSPDPTTRPPPPGRGFGDARCLPSTGAVSGGVNDLHGSVPDLRIPLQLSASQLANLPVDVSGFCRTRFAASVPISGHPAIHPGALFIKPDGSFLREWSHPRCASIDSGPALSFAIAPPQEEVGHVEHSHSAPSLPTSRTLRSCGVGPVGVGEDLFWPSGPSEEERLLAADEVEGTAGRLPGSLERRGTVDRVGEVMALLGPRYKTLPRGMVWQKASEGGMTLWQRRVKRLSATTASCGRRSETQGASAPEDAPDLDTEAGPRAAWLARRAQERDRRDRAPG